jgi:hypothetical protein
MAALAQEQTAPLDGPQRVFHDELLDKLAGNWKLTGKFMGQAADHTVAVKWTLNHQFLRIHEKSLTQPKGGTRVRGDCNDWLRQCQ